MRWINDRRCAAEERRAGRRSVAVMSGDSWLPGNPSASNSLPFTRTSVWWSSSSPYLWLCVKDTHSRGEAASPKRVGLDTPLDTGVKTNPIKEKFITFKRHNISGMLNGDFKMTLLTLYTVYSFTVASPLFPCSYSQDWVFWKKSELD